MARRKRVWLAVAVATIIAVGAAYAAIPSPDGVISACYGKRTGVLRVVDAEAGTGCTKSERALSWNQVGPQGPPGGAVETTVVSKTVDWFDPATLPVEGLVEDADTKEVSVECPEGTSLVSGGFDGRKVNSDGNPGLIEGPTIFASAPSGNSWLARARGFVSAEGSFAEWDRLTVFAICG